MNILIIGASGFLGYKAYEILSRKYKDERKIIGTYSNHAVDKLLPLDITKQSSFDELKKRLKQMNAMPQVVIHTAAISDVDYCELHPADADLINVQGTMNVIKNFDCKIIYISTDFVFEGNRGHYSEDDKPNPINYYAKSKFEGERVVQKHCKDYIIARVAVLYGHSMNEKKFVNWTIEQLKNNKPIRVVTDQIVTPTLIDDIVNALDVLINQNAKGIFHVAGSETISRYDMAVAVALAFNLDKKLITAVPSSEFKQPAKRPKNTSLNINKIRNLGIKMSSFKEGIIRLKEQLEKK
ncbi:SDR family oxidoreductase [Candidatus Woesearchaeota archaeon]|nr:SDR family oxidoreductase [Candidatus Woesearchaeota archaeon]